MFLINVEYVLVKISRNGKTIVILLSSNISGVTSTCFEAAKMELWFKCLRGKQKILY